jgi:AsmA protein
MMRAEYKGIAVKIVKISGIAIAAVLLLLFLIPILFPGQIAEKVKAFANKKLEGELNFKEAKLSFYNHFPSLTVTLDDFSLKGSAPFKEENLIKSEEVAFGINVMSLIFDSTIKIDQIFVSNAEMNVLVNEKGEANYNVYISEKSDKKDTEGTSLRLDKIDIENSHLVYNDKSAKILIDAKGFNYVGNGDLDKAIFDLYTEAKIDSFDFSFAGEEYLKNKKVDADLITQINTNSLAFVFQQNNLVINKLPVEFLGKLNFLKNGYDIDFSAKSENSNLNDLFTALPPQYVQWLEKTKVKGKTDLMLTFKGRYSAATNTKPDLAFAMNVRKGSISYKDSPFPASDIEMKFRTKLPSLNSDDLIVNLDTLSFNIDKDFMRARIYSKGSLNNMLVLSNIKSRLDLAKLDRSVGFENMDFQGLFSANIKSNGIFNTAKQLFPKTEGFVNLENGKLKTKYYPNPIESIQFKGKIKNTTGKYKDLNVSLTPASFLFEGNPIYLQAILSDLEDINYDIKAKGNLDVGRIYKVFAQKGLSVNGFIKADVAFKGRQSYAASGQYDKLYSKGTLEIRNIVTTSQYFPKPFIINEGKFTFNRDKMWFNTFIANYGQSDFVMNGYLQNAINFVLAKKGTLKGNFSVNSNLLNVDEFMAEATENTKEPNAESVSTGPEAKGVVLLPSNLALSLAAKVKKVSFKGLNLNDLDGNIALEGGKMKLTNTGFGLIGSKMMVEGVYDDINNNKADFNLRFITKEFDIKKAYNEIQLFRDLVTAAEKAEGIISVDYKLKGVLDETMRPSLSSLQGGGVVSVKKVKMKGFKLFGAVSKKTGSDEINDPDLSEFDIQSVIKNKVITVAETKVKVALFRLRFKGETNFDGQLNLKMRLGLPPIGLIGIPVVITGTHDNPKVKVFSKTGQEVEETEYIEQKPQTAVPPTTSAPKK